MWETSAQLTDAFPFCPHWGWADSTCQAGCPPQGHDETLKKKTSVQDPEPGSSFCKFRQGDGDQGEGAGLWRR
jgi:hypothetical protein